MNAKIKILGCGGSMGVPVIGKQGAKELLKDPYNSRLRTSALISIDQKNFLLDVGPDFRQQALTHDIINLDGVLLTHAHFDHISGLDELRIYYFLHKKPIPILASEDTLAEIHRRYYYLIDQTTQVVNKDQKYTFQSLPKDFGLIEFQGIHFTYVSYSQASMKVNGYRLGNMAYITDIKDFNEEIFQWIEGVDLLFISALRYQRSPVHFNIEQAIDFSKKVKAKQTYLIHLSNELEYHETNSDLPKGFALAYDGLEVDFDV